MGEPRPHIFCLFGMGREYSECISYKSLKGNITEPTKGSRTFYANSVPDMRDTRHLVFMDTNVHYFPLGLHNLCPFLTMVQITNCGLKQISRKDLVGLEKLENLWITDCLLTELPDNLLVGMSKLIRINFSKNRITSASSKLVEPLYGRSVWINLSYNNNCHLLVNQSIYNNFSLEEFGRLIDKNFGKRAEGTLLNKFHEELAGKIGKLWPSGRFSDFTIIVGSKRFSVHKNVLGIHSAVFAREFDGNASLMEMKIENFSERAVNNVLHFMYTGQIANAENTEENLKIAAKLEVPGMTENIEEVFHSKLATANLRETYDILLMAEQNQCTKLKQHAYQRISYFFPTNFHVGKKLNPQDMMHSGLDLVPRSPMCRFMPSIIKHN